MGLDGVDFGVPHYMRMCVGMCVCVLYARVRGRAEYDSLEYILVL